MTTYNLFIGYSGKDKQSAEFVFSCLSQIKEIRPYLAEIIPDYGEDFKKRILNALDKADFMVVFLTENGVQSQWVNQEIGYAFALKRKRYIQIIPISLKNIELRGLITKDTEDILYLDNLPFDRVIQHIIYQIRNHVPRGWNRQKFTWRIKCNYCLDKEGVNKIYDACLPSDSATKNAIMNNELICTSICPKCKKPNYLNILTLLPSKPPNQSPETKKA
jgi:hypothetical protein